MKDLESYLIDSFPNIKDGYENFKKEYEKINIEITVDIDNGQIYYYDEDDNINYIQLTLNDIYGSPKYPFNKGDFVKHKSDGNIYLVYELPYFDIRSSQADINKVNFTTVGNYYWLIGRDPFNPLYWVSTGGIFPGKATGDGELLENTYYTQLEYIKPNEISDPMLLLLRDKIINGFDLCARENFDKVLSLLKKDPYHDLI